MTALELQRRLSALGFDPGPIDGVRGRRTIAATRAFQASRGLVADGIVGPKTRAALLGDSATARERISEASLLPPWLEEAERRIGLNETRDRAELSAFLKSDGASVGDPAKLPWCGDFVETCVALTLPDEPLPTNPYLARNWQDFGARCEPRPGAILVFWRTSKLHSTNGHVAFYKEERSDAFRVVGGNQSNSVSEAWLGKDRLLACRWPKTFPLTASGAVAATNKSGALSANEA